MASRSCGRAIASHRADGGSQKFPPNMIHAKKTSKRKTYTQPLGVDLSA